MSTPNLSIYVHIPFCRSRCSYCDFNTYAGQSNLIERYIDALFSELAWYQKAITEKFLVHTVYFGGGSPDLLNIRQFKKVLDGLAGFKVIHPSVEISTELNPGKLTFEYLETLKESGINRISIGMQSSNPDELKLLGRKHSYAQVKDSVQSARRAGFGNINLDLIYGIPGQLLDVFKNSLKQALDLGPDHLSLYTLHLEPHVPLARMISSGTIPQPDDDLAADMYEWAIVELADNGYQQYEISNWSRQSDEADFRCIHNLQYWYNLDYLGIGAGAHSFVENRRWENVARIPEYCSTWQEIEEKSSHHSPAILNERLMTRSDQIQETIMMGLRLTEEGIMEGNFLERFGERISDLYPSQIKRMTDIGLLEWKGKGDQKCLRLTRRGRMLGNQVFAEFIDDAPSNL